MQEVIAQGTNVNDLQYLDQYDNRYNEGDYYELHLNFGISLAADIAGRVSQAIIDAGWTGYYDVSVQGSTLILKAQKGFPFPFAVVIPFILGVLAGVLLITFINWVLYRIGVLPFDLASNNVLLVTIGMIAIGLLLLRR